MKELGYFDYCVPLSGHTITIGDKYKLKCGNTAMDSKFFIDNGEMAGIAKVEIIIDANNNDVPVMKVRFHGETVDEIAKHFWRRD